MAKDHKRLGDLLLEEKLISPEDLSRAVTQQRKSGQLLGATLVQLGLVAETDMLDCLHRQLGLPLVDLASLDIDESTVALIKEDVAKKYLAQYVAIFEWTHNLKRFTGDLLRAMLTPAPGTTDST